MLLLAEDPLLALIRHFGGERPSQQLFSLRCVDRVGDGVEILGGEQPAEESGCFQDFDLALFEDFLDVLFAYAVEGHSLFCGEPGIHLSVCG